MTGLTVEERIASNFNCSVASLLQDYANRGMTSKEVAKRLDCGVSNVRRIARKYKVSFNQQPLQTKYTQTKSF